MFILKICLIFAIYAYKYNPSIKIYKLEFSIDVCYVI